MMPSSNTRKRLWRAALGIAVAATLIWLTLSVVVAYKFTRRPHPLVAEPMPAITWSAIEQVRLRTSDGLQLGAWYLAGRESGPSVVLLHGFRRNRAATMPQAEMLVKEGCSVLTVSQRAHGDSQGDYCDVGYSARHDVVAAVEWFEKRRPNKPIFVQGISMGAAAAIFAGDELQTRVSGYILECPYRDLRSAVRTRTSAYLPRPLDSVAYTGLNLFAPIFMPDIDRMSPEDAAKKIPASVPVLIFSGGHDDRALPDDVRAIYDGISSHARLVVVPTARHDNIISEGGAAYCDAVVEMLRKK